MNFLIPSDKKLDLKKALREDCRICDKVIGEHGVTFDMLVQDTFQTFSQIYSYLFEIEARDGSLCWTCSKALVSAFHLRRKIENNEKLFNIHKCSPIKKERMMITTRMDEEVVSNPLIEPLVSVKVEPELQLEVEVSEKSESENEYYSEVEKLVKVKKKRNRHRIQRREHEEIRCPLCDYKSHVKDNYQKHVLRTHKRQEMKCDGCEKSYHLIYLLDEHRASVHDFTHEYVVDEALKLKTPVKKFNLYKVQKVEPGIDLSKVKKEFASDEIENETSSESIRCPLCSYCSNKSSSFVKHYRKMHDNLQFQCDGCSAKDHHYYRLLRHRKVNHNFDHEYKIDESLKLVDRSRKEQRRIEKGQEFPCPECDQWFKQKRLISKHLRVVHKLKARPKGRPSTHSQDSKPSHIKSTYFYPTYKICCIYCGKSLSNNTIEIHIRNMHPEHRDPYICSYCGEKSKTKITLLYHMQKSHNFAVRNSRGTEAAFACSYCPKIFRFKTSRRAHEIRYHTFEFEFSCEICEKKFVDKYQLNDHRQRHAEGKRPNLRCEICKEYFTRKALLAKHLSTHFENEPSPYPDFLPQNLSQLAAFR